MLVDFAELTVMMLAGLLFLLSLTGGSASDHSAQPDLLGDQQMSNYSFEGSGSASNHSVQPEPLDEEKSNYSFEENGDSSKHKCTLRDVVKYLNLTKYNENSMTRPGKEESPTKVYLEVKYSAILDVNEKDQKFISSLLIDVWWEDESLSWMSWDFCRNIWRITLYTKLLWKPDLTIEEMIKMENTQQSPYVKVYADGYIRQRIRMVVATTCYMEVYKFPFDVQNCSLSFRSIMHSAGEMTFETWNDAQRTKELTEELMRTGSEWLFVNHTTENKTSSSVLVYTITMRRRSVLYIANFLLPVLFFFLLDLASFLISDSSSEKLSFKVTVLLAITVMQLILSEILPSTSSKVPLIAVYCIGMFGLMMISLFETILVMHLMEKDNEADEDQRPKSDDCEDTQSKVSSCCCSKELKKWTPCARVCDVSVDESPSELLSTTKEGNSSEMTEESIALEKVSDELKEVIQLLNSREEAGKLGYWTRLAKTINKVFVILHVTAAIVFLVVLFSLWHS